MIGWHFLRGDRCLQFGDRQKVIVGETLSCEGELKLCRKGMHASTRAIDALGYAPGGVVCFVELSGEILHDGDKSCARSRRVLAMVDANETLHEFVCFWRRTSFEGDWCKGREVLGSDRDNAAMVSRRGERRGFLRRTGRRMGRHTGRRPGRTGRRPGRTGQAESRA